MADSDTEVNVTVDDILRGALRLIEDFGWEEQGWNHHGAKPRCIRKALWDSAARLCPEVNARHYPALNEALRRVSEAIYDKPGAVGGILDWEYKRRTDQEAVIAVLRKAIDAGPSDRQVGPSMGAV